MMYAKGSYADLKQYPDVNYVAWLPKIKNIVMYWYQELLILGFIIKCREQNSAVENNIQQFYLKFSS